MSTAAEITISHLSYVGVFLAAMGATDAAICFFLPGLRPARWKVLHAVANLMVALLSMQDVITTVVHPIASCNGE